MAKKGFQPDKFSFKESVAALKTVPRFFVEIYHSNRILFTVNALCRLVSALLPLAMLWVGKLIVDEVVLQMGAEKASYQVLLQWVLLEFALAVSSDIIARTTSYTDGLLGDQYSIQSSVKIIKKTSDLNLSQLEDADFYDKLERARQQTTGRVGLMSNILTQVQDLIVVISLMAGIVAFEPVLIILLLVSVIPTLINEIKFSGTSYSLARSWTQERRELDYLRYAGASDVTAKEVKLFGLAGYLASRFEKLSWQYYADSKSLSKRRALWGSGFNIVSSLAYYGAYILIIFKTVGGIFTLGDLTFLSGSFNNLRGRIQGFFIRFTSITNSALYLQDYFDFLDIKIGDSGHGKKPMPAELKEGFKFENVGFKYPGTDIWVVRGINFEFKAGEKLAFVGENGAGKTTLIKLLLNFYEPTEGCIYLDGTPINEFDRAEYQEYFGVIFQDFVKFELTMRENIAVGAISALDDQQRINSASEKSLASEVINAVPDGLDQKLGRRFSKGTNLSGGQWQKVAMARAYMKDAEVLVLDEPTSALDARAESETFDRFINLTKGKSAIIISHRFSTVRIADRILVLKDGKVHELGTHEELMASPKLYAELFNLQASGYI
ncbi:ABC transporter ATP-binding protein [Luteibaculum oceani]|uniref:ABC transporter ATP-binding protein n=1 Tax=Luteibaculum oceani TaxID=1294296 RepID=A0A5C6V1H5_9FLAO|nr:ABC transporter ATP-binding protein [Luteibaculum oceani]TXC78824.1 ABC transporter ATP-binding protein [Luteibaculum oceani]